MKKSKSELIEISKEIRTNIIEMLGMAGSGHPGGSLSSVELLLVLFYNWIERNKENALDEDRDRFIISKGHGVPTLYAILAKLGIIKESELKTFRKLNSRLQGHPDRNLLPYVEASTGSLGQGLSIAQGVALSGKIDKKDFRVYCLIGDGETQEGQIWEAFMSASTFKLDNLCVILDYNKGQIDGFVNDIINLEPIVDRLNAFGWYVQRIDGHDIDAIEDALTRANNTKGKPSIIIADTVKGKGVSFMENKIEWHGVAPNDEQTKAAIEEIQR